MLKQTILCYLEYFADQEIKSTIECPQSLVVWDPSFCELTQELLQEFLDLLGYALDVFQISLD